jgi:putative drug exporter of the RND superfamily
MDIKPLATGLGIGILIDATIIIRALLLPALFALFGGWNWWLPSGLVRLLRIDENPFESRAQQGDRDARPSLSTAALDATPRR